MRIVKVLDSGEMKIYPETSMVKKGQEYRILLGDLFVTRDKTRSWSEWSDEHNEMRNRKGKNPKYKPWTPKMNHALELFYEESRWDKTNIDRERSAKMMIRFIGLEESYAFLGRIPFNPCVMINISPAWKGSAITDDKIEGFRRVIVGYLKEMGRYTKWKFCFECGSDGDFLHAHIVAEVNPDLIKSVLDGKRSHIGKGNHYQQIKKKWKKEKWTHASWSNAIDGKFAVQVIIIRNEKMRDDKLAYLIEENKTDGHQNKYDLKKVFNSGF